MMENDDVLVAPEASGCMALRVRPGSAGGRMPDLRILRDCLGPVHLAWERAPRRSTSSEGKVNPITLIRIVGGLMSAGRGQADTTERFRFASLCLPPFCAEVMSLLSQ